MDDAFQEEKTDYESGQLTQVTEDCEISIAQMIILENVQDGDLTNHKNSKTDDITTDNTAADDITTDFTTNGDHITFEVTNIETIEDLEHLTGYITDRTEKNHDTVPYENIEIVVSESDAVPWYCPYRPCLEFFNNVDNLSRHILSSHITRVFKCDNCDRLFHRQSEHDQHATIHDENNDTFADIFAVDDSILDVDIPVLFTDPDNSIKLYKCCHCDKTFGKKASLSKHVETHSRVYQCSECDKSFGNMRALTSHMLMHSDVKAFPCDKCDKCYRDKYHLKQHMKVHSDIHPYTCPHCQSEYSAESNLRVHVFNKHFDGINDCHYSTCSLTNTKRFITKDDDTRFKCSNCHQGFARKNDLDKHDVDKCKIKNILKCKGCDKKFDNTEDRGKHEAVCLVNTSADKNSNTFAHRCAVCDRRFSEYVLLTRHLLTHTKPYPCLVCNKSYESKTYLKSHMLMHNKSRDKPSELNVDDGTSDKSGGSLVCDICGMKFRRQFLLRRHKLTHVTDVPYKCVYCQKNFSERNPLKLHVFNKHFDFKTDTLYYKCPIENIDYFLTESDAQRYVCKPCKKPFVSKFYLIEHKQQKHSSNPRPFLCTQCGDGFPNKTRLRLHVQSHAKTRNFQCAVCGVKCTTKSSLSSHMTVHSEHRPYACDFCDKTFARRIQLTRHGITHTGERTHQCDVCGKMFPTPSDVKKHSVVHQTYRSRPFLCTVCKKSFTKQAYLNNHMRLHQIKFVNSGAWWPELTAGTNLVQLHKIVTQK